MNEPLSQVMQLKISLSGVGLFLFNSKPDCIESQLFTFCEIYATNVFSFRHEARLEKCTFHLLTSA
jgi:hypothetical protein